jgi:Lrp/AsnC family leucine-responsive transcriptional regulator
MSFYLKVKLSTERSIKCHHVSDYDYISKNRCKGYVSGISGHKLTTLKHIGSTQSTFMISEVKNTTTIAL